MEKKRWFHVVILVVAAAILMNGCTNSKEASEKLNEDPQDKLQIGLCFDSFVIERWIRDREVFDITAKSKGAEVNVQNANGNVDEQIAQIEYFIKKKVDVIVIIAVDGERLKDVVKKAKNEGIKIVAYDRLIKNADVDLYISFDNEEVGRLMAKTLVSQVPEGGKIYTIKGPITDNNVDLVEKGFNEVISQSDLEIVYSANCENWLAEQAYDAVYNGLKKSRDVAGIMCGNDDLATQAFRALSENRLAGKVVMVGQDADLSACQRIVEETQAMTVYKPVEKLAQAAAEYAIMLGNGEEIETEDTIFDGTYDVPSICLTPIAVTKDNMDEVIIENNFHTREQVYLNVELE